MKLFIFGSTGDLVRRKVMKALQDLNKPELEIFAIGRRNFDKEEYREFICSDWCSLNFRKNIHYIRVEFENLKIENFEKHLNKEKINFFYISLPPGMYKPIFKFLSKFLPNYKIKVLVEKPFGEDEKSALDIQDFLENSKMKEHIIISDHYLFKEGFFNFDKKKVKDAKKIKIVSHENLGLEKRHGYYDSAGAMKDIIQSHFLNLIMKNLGIKLNPKRIKLKKMVKGQYEDYEKELGKKSDTETFSLIEFESEGKTFHLSTGKAMKNKETFIEIDEEKVENRNENSYVKVFKDFLSLNTEKFPTPEESVLGWKILESLQKQDSENKKSSKLLKYKKGSDSKEILGSQKNL